MGADGKAPPAVQLRGVTKHFGKVIAVHEIDLDIPGRFFDHPLGPIRVRQNNDSEDDRRIGETDPG